MAKRKKTTSSLKKLAWSLCSKVVRLTYAGNGAVRCYTCPTIDLIAHMQAGHAIGGRHNAVLFDEEIIKPQCVRCNIFLRGNYQVFITKLIQEHGLEWWEKKLEGSRQIVKMTRGDLEQLIESYRERLSLLEANATCEVFDHLDTPVEALGEVKH